MGGFCLQEGALCTASSGTHSGRQKTAPRQGEGRLGWGSGPGGAGRRLGPWLLTSATPYPPGVCFGRCLIPKLPYPLLYSAELLLSPRATSSERPFGPVGPDLRALPSPAVPLSSCPSLWARVASVAS